MDITKTEIKPLTLNNFEKMVCGICYKPNPDKIALTLVTDNRNGNRFAWAGEAYHNSCLIAATRAARAENGMSD